MGRNKNNSRLYHFLQGHSIDTTVFIAKHSPKTIIAQV